MRAYLWKLKTQEMVKSCVWVRCRDTVEVMADTAFQFSLITSSLTFGGEFAPHFLDFGKTILKKVKRLLDNE